MRKRQRGRSRGRQALVLLQRRQRPRRRRRRRRRGPHGGPPARLRRDRQHRRRQRFGVQSEVRPLAVGAGAGSLAPRPREVRLVADGAVLFGGGARGQGLGGGARAQEVGRQGPARRSRRSRRSEGGFRSYSCCSCHWPWRRLCRCLSRRHERAARGQRRRRQRLGETGPQVGAARDGLCVLWRRRRRRRARGRRSGSRPRARPRAGPWPWPGQGRPWRGSRRW